jgi:hypothetical protein
MSTVRLPGAGDVAAAPNVATSAACMTTQVRKVKEHMTPAMCK